LNRVLRLVPVLLMIADAVAAQSAGAAATGQPTQFGRTGCGYPFHGRLTGAQVDEWGLTLGLDSFVELAAVAGTFGKPLDAPGQFLIGLTDEAGTLLARSPEYVSAKITDAGTYRARVTLSEAAASDGAVHPYFAVIEPNPCTPPGGKGN
jgi:hypothetical protein